MGVHIGATWRIRLNDTCAAAMRPYIKLLWLLVNLPAYRIIVEGFTVNDLCCLCILSAKFHYTDETGPDPTRQSLRTCRRSGSPTKSGRDRLVEFARNTHPFNGPLSETTQVSRYQKGKTSLDFIQARDSEWQWHQLGHMQVCNSIRTDNHANTHHSVFYRLDALPAAKPTASTHWRPKFGIKW